MRVGVLVLTIFELNPDTIFPFFFSGSVQLMESYAFPKPHSSDLIPIPQKILFPQLKNIF